MKKYLAVAIIVLLLITAALLVWTVGNLSVYNAQREAEAFCMQWKIKEAALIDGVIYCRMEVNIPFAGVIYTVSQWYSEDEMWLQNGLLLREVTPQP